MIIGVELFVSWLDDEGGINIPDTWKEIIRQFIQERPNFSKNPYAKGSPNNPSTPVPTDKKQAALDQRKLLMDLFRTALGPAKDSK